MKKLLALCLTAILCLCCLASCDLLTPTIERFIPNEQIASVEIKTLNYETGIEEITEKYVLSAEQSNEIKSLLNEITYVKRYNILQEKWTFLNDVKYVFTFETQKVVLSENHVYIYDINDALLKHVEFNSSTFNDYLEEINDVLQSGEEVCEHIWDEGVEVEGGNGGYVMEYTCTLCGNKQRETITIIPPSGASRSITYQSESTKELLMEGFAPISAKSGDTVVLRTNPLMDADLTFYANGVRITQTYADYDYWEYVFIMPDEDVVITHEITDGFLPD